MKRLIPAILILIFIITVCVTCNMYVQKKCEKTIADVENCFFELKQNNNFVAHSKANAIKENWEKDKHKLEFFLNHKFIDQVSVCMSQLPVLTENSSVTAFSLTLENLKCVLNEIKEEQKLNLHSFY